MLNLDQWYSVLLMFCIQFSFIIMSGVANMVGGRWRSVAGETSRIDGRWTFRAILPAFMAGLIAFGTLNSWKAGLVVWFISLAGATMWSRFGWSFDEINGGWSPDRYPSWLRKIGLKLFPGVANPHQNRMRGMFMKNIRGLYDFTNIGFALLSPWALLLYPLHGLQGFIYWLVGKCMKEVPTTVLTAEFYHGCYYGALRLSGILIVLYAWMFNDIWVLKFFK